MWYNLHILFLSRHRSFHLTCEVLPGRGPGARAGHGGGLRADARLLHAARDVGACAGQLGHGRPPLGPVGPGVGAEAE